jgi:hypothetical protein
MIGLFWTSNIDWAQTHDHHHPDTNAGSAWQQDSYSECFEHDSNVYAI